MSKSTILAKGHIHMSDELVVWLIEPNNDPPLVTDEPPRIRVEWPPYASVCTPAKLAEVAAAACRILASASTEMSRLTAARNKRRPR
jgi:hypothetical protein